MEDPPCHYKYGSQLRIFFIKPTLIFSSDLYPQLIIMFCLSNLISRTITVAVISTLSRKFVSWDHVSKTNLAYERLHFSSIPFASPQWAFLRLLFAEPFTGARRPQCRHLRKHPCRTVMLRHAEPSRMEDEKGQPPAIDNRGCAGYSSAGMPCLVPS